MSMPKAEDRARYREVFGGSKPDFSGKISFQNKLGESTIDKPITGSDSDPPSRSCSIGRASSETIALPQSNRRLFALGLGRISANVPLAAAVDCAGRPRRRALRDHRLGRKRAGNGAGPSVGTETGEDGSDRNRVDPARAVAADLRTGHRRPRATFVLSTMPGEPVMRGLMMTVTNLGPMHSFRLRFPLHYVDYLKEIPIPQNSVISLLRMHGTRQRWSNSGRWWRDSTPGLSIHDRQSCGVERIVRVGP